MNKKKLEATLVFTWLDWWEIKKNSAKLFFSFLEKSWRYTPKKKKNYLEYLFLLFFIFSIPCNIPQTFEYCPFDMIVSINVKKKKNEG